MAEDERTVGVDGDEGTAVPTDGVPESAPATAPEPKAEPKPKPVNLDELEEFRRFKSQADRRDAEMRRQLEEAQRLLQEQQRREVERQQREYEARIRNAPDDYSRLEIEREYERQARALERQQLQQLQQELETIRGQQNIERAKREWTQQRLSEYRAELREAFGEDVEIPRAVLADIEAADHPTKVEAALTRFMREQQKAVLQKAKEETRRRERVDDVDVGAGAPRSPSSEEREQWEKATRSNDLIGAFALKAGQAAKRR